MLLVGSNVFNLIDWTINGVEPCTGVALCTVPLAEIISHQLQGPRFTLGLRFNPFSDRNEGFGVGWEINLPRILPVGSSTRRLLRLADGQRYLLPDTLPAIGQPVALVNKKTNTFKCVRSGSDEFTLYHKNGNHDIVRGDLAYACRDAANRGVLFEWDSNQRLIRVKQEGDNKLLLETTINGQELTVRHRIHSETKARRDCYRLSLEGALLTLQEVENLNDTAPVKLYTFNYEVHNQNYVYLKELAQPYYFNRRSTFRYRQRPSPPGLTTPISWVDQQQIYSGHVTDNTDVMTRVYREQRSNFLGASVVTQWQDNQDNLHTLNDDFRFELVETANGLGISRHYNKYYLLVSEKRQRAQAGGTTYRQCDFHYGLETGTGKNLSHQSATFDLAIYEQRLFFTQGQTTPDRKVELRYSYDDYANLLQHINEEGIGETLSYYPASGETDNCPAEPQGFIRFMKQRLIIPHNDIDPTLAKVYHYRYQTIATSTPSLIMPVETTQAIRSTKKIIEKTEYSYRSSGDFLGCLLEETISSDVTGALPRARLTTRYDRELKEDLLWTTKSLIAQITSSAEITSLSAQDPVTGEQVAIIHPSSDKNSPGPQDRFSYDYFGRCIKSVYALGSTYEMTETCKYLWQQNCLSVKHSDRLNLHQETLYDRMGREVLQKTLSHYKQNNEDKTLVIASEEKHYNSQGQLSWKQETDERLSADETSLWAVVKLLTQYQWNEFGELTQTTYADGSNEKIDYQQRVIAAPPIGYRIIRTHTPGERKITEDYNTWGKLIKKTVQATGTSQVVEEYSYDGMNNISHQSNSLLGGKSFFYDAFSRLLYEISEENNNWKHIAYFEYTSAELPVRITVGNMLRITERFNDHSHVLELPSPSDARQNPIVVGERDYDDFGREIQTTTNGVITQRHYKNPRTPWLISEEQVGNKTLTYEYIDELGILKTVTATDTNEPERNISTLYEYDNRRLLTKEETTFSPIAVNLNGRQMKQLIKTFTYNSPGDVKQEKRTLVYTDSSISSEVTTIINSISTNGRLCYRSTTLGNVTWLEDYRFHASKGYLTMALYQMNGKELLRHEPSYNAYGQPIKITQVVEEKHHFSQQCKYDAVGRYAGKNFYKNTNEKPKSTGVKYAETTFTYDAIDRLRAVNYRFDELSQNASAREEYFYTATGELNEWRRSGDIRLLDDYSHECTGQKITLDILGNQQEIITQRKNQPELTSKYTYNDNKPFSCMTIKRLGFNDSTFIYDNEGNTQEENSNSKTVYQYNAQGNIRSIKISTANGTAMKHHKFHLSDGNGHQHLTFSFTAEGRYSATQLLFNDGKLAASYDLYMNDTSNRQTVIYHRCQGELLGMTLVNASNQYYTALEMAMPNGTSIARVSQFQRSERTISPTLLDYKYYYMVSYRFAVDIVGCNAYGFAYQSQRLTYNREASKELSGYSLPEPFKRRIKRTR